MVVVDPKSGKARTSWRGVNRKPGYEKAGFEVYSIMADSRAEAESKAEEIYSKEMTRQREAWERGDYFGKG